MKPVILAGLTLSLAAASFAAGRLSTPQALEFRAAPAAGMVLTQNSSPAASPSATPRQAPDDPRELIPLGPGQQPGQRPGQRPGQQPGQGTGECPVQIYQGGKLYTFPQPGQQPQPEQGNGPQPGQPGQPQELIPLGPGNGGGGSTPSSPGTPPAALPVNPGTRS